MNNEMPGSVPDLCKRYDIKVLDTNKRAPVIINTEFFKDEKDKNLIHSNRAKLSEPLYTVTIPYSRLEILAKIESAFFNNIDHIGNRRVFEAWLDQQEKERTLRNAHPAVQAAYEQYSLMLSLSSQGLTADSFRLPPY